MRKNSFLEGAMIATLGIFISRVIGLLYVIPFYALIGTKGGALYSYGYSIYAIFLSLSSSGIPIAISKLVSEYNALGFYHTKERVFRIGTFLIFCTSFFFFLVLTIFASQIAFLILGNIEGGNTIEGVTMVIRVVGIALLVVPFLSVTKGYLQGHKFIYPATVSTVLEQIIRVIVILAGSFFALKVFNLSIDTAVGIAMFGATAGALVAYFYLIFKIKKNSDKLNTHEAITREEAHFTKMDIAKKIIFYAIPFIVIDLVKSFTGIVDTFTVVRTLSDLGYSASISETAFAVMTTWGSKLNMIIVSIAIGMSVSLIPNLASSFVKKDMHDVSRKVNQAMTTILFLTIPMSIGLSFLARPVWIIFYGYNQLSIDVFKVMIFQTIIYSLFTILLNSIQTMNDTKVSVRALIGVLVGKIVLNIPVMYLLYKIQIAAYYGPIVTNLITQTFAIIYILYVLNSKYKINYQDSLNKFLKLIFTSTIMFVSLKIMTIFIPLDSLTRIDALVETIIYTAVGALIFAITAHKLNLINEVFGSHNIKKITKRLSFKR